MGIIMPSAQANVNVLVAAHVILQSLIPGVIHQMCYKEKFIIKKKRVIACNLRKR